MTMGRRTRTSRCVAGAIAVLLAFSAAVETLPAHEPLQRAEWAARVREKAGGYGFLTPLIYAITRGVELHARHAAGGPHPTAGELFDFASDRKFLGGLAGDLVFTALATAMTAGLPGGGFLKSILPVAAGFVGWEVGSGEIARSDWGALSAQIAVASVTHFAANVVLRSIGFPAAGLVAALLSSAAGIATGVWLDRRHERERHGLAPVLARPPPSGPGAPVSADSRALYRQVVEKLRTASPSEARADYERLRSLSPAPAAAR